MSHPFEFRDNTIDANIFDCVIVHNEYRLPTHFDADDIVIDIGAHIGSFTYAVLQRGAKHVYAFEADPSNYQRIIHNLRDFADQVTVQQKAVWRSDTPVEYLFFDSSLDAENTAGGGVVGASSGQKIPAISLDQIIREASDNGERRIRLLRIDCEGAEYPILLTSSLLSHVDAICGEFHELETEHNPNTIPSNIRVAGYNQFSADALAEFLERQGFHVVFERSSNPVLGLFLARRATAFDIPAESERKPYAAQQRWSRSALQQRLAAVACWEHQVEVAPGIFTHAYDPTYQRLAALSLPADLSGLRVLDVGTLDGAFSFECERRGAAEVLAIDLEQRPGFTVLHELLESQVRFEHTSVYNLVPESLGSFDLVLCLGLLHRLQHPSVALERLRSVCHGTLILEIPLAAQDTQANDQRIWWLAQPELLTRMVVDAGFHVQQQYQQAQSLYIHAQSVTQTQERERVLGAWDRDLLAQHERSLPHTCGQLHHEIFLLEQEIAQREQHLANLLERTQWLQQLGETSQQNLKAIEQGRLMRFLRRFQ